MFAHKLLVFAVLPIALASIAAGQEIPDDGLPHKIGAGQCSESIRGRNSVLTGTVNVMGSWSGAKPPTVSIAVYGSGAFINRQRISKGGSYTFNCLPNDVSLAVEVDGKQVEQVQVGFLQPPPFINRQDVSVNIAADAADKPVNGVVNASSLYKRSSENQALFDKAVAAAAKGKSDDAVDSLKKLVKNDPKDFVALVQLGNFAFNKAAYDDASKTFQEALELAPTYIPAEVGAGRAALALKSFDKAIEILSKAYDLHPESADVNHYLGEAYLQDKKGSLAIVHMRKAMDIEPVKKADLHLRLGWLYNAAGAKQLAAEEYKMLLKVVPDHPQKAGLEKYIKQNSPAN